MEFFKKKPQKSYLSAVFLAGAFFVAVFLAAGFLAAAAFLAGAFLVVSFSALATVFLAAFFFGLTITATLFFFLLELPYVPMVLFPFAVFLSPLPMFMF